MWNLKFQTGLCCERQLPIHFVKYPLANASQSIAEHCNICLTHAKHVFRKAPWNIDHRCVWEAFTNTLAPRLLGCDGKIHKTSALKSVWDSFMRTPIPHGDLQLDIHKHRYTYVSCVSSLCTKCWFRIRMQWIYIYEYLYKMHIFCVCTMYLKCMSCVYNMYRQCA